jgi:hypothetical protein
MVSVLSSSAVYRGFEAQSGKSKDYKMCICCFSAKHVALRRKIGSEQHVYPWTVVSVN